MIAGIASGGNSTIDRRDILMLLSICGWPGGGYPGCIVRSPAVDLRMHDWAAYLPGGVRAGGRPDEIGSCPGASRVGAGGGWGARGPAKVLPC